MMVFLVIQYVWIFLIIITKFPSLSRIKTITILSQRLIEWVSITFLFSYLGLHLSFHACEEIVSSFTIFIILSFKSSSSSFSVTYFNFFQDTIWCIYLALSPDGRVESIGISCALTCMEPTVHKIFWQRLFFTFGIISTTPICNMSFTINICIFDIIKKYFDWTMFSYPDHCVYNLLFTSLIIHTILLLLLF